MSGSTWLWIVLAVVVAALLAAVVSRSRGDSGSGAAPARPGDGSGVAPAAGGAPAESGAAPDSGTADAPAAAAAADTAPATPGTAGTPAPEPGAPPDADGAAAGTGGADDERRPARPSDSALASLDAARMGTGTGSGAGAAAAAVTELREGPHPGSVLPAADGSAPDAEYTVKANEGSKRFHDDASPYFFRTRADVWFRSAADAEAAGFTAWNSARS